MDLGVNLIKSRAGTLRKRRRIFLGMISYLALCGATFMALSYHVWTNFIHTNGTAEEISIIENKFASIPLKKGHAIDITKDMKTELVYYIDELEVIDKVLSRRTNLAPLFVRLSRPLSNGAYIDNFSFNNADEILSFNIVMPEAQGRETFNTSDLISAWKQDKALMADIERIESKASHQYQRGNRLVLVSQFMCTLSKEAR